MDRFLERNRQFKILVSNPFAYLDYRPSIGISVDLLVDLLEAKELLQSLSARNYHSRISSHMNISSIIVRSSEEGPPLLLSTLHSIQSALEIFDLDRNIKASALFSLPSLENLAKESEKSLQKITTFLNRSKSFITVEIPSEKGQSLDDGWFSHYMIKKATLACSLLNSKIPIVFKLKNFQADSNGVNISDFMEKVPISIASHPLLKQRVLGLFLQAPAFETVHRELLGGKEAIHDTYSTPITVPSTIPTPTIVTVPSTNPVPVLPSNPSPITIPSTNPLPTPVMNPANPTNSPVTIPATNPMPDPVTNPTTNPVLSPPVMPVTNPANQPVITSPYSQPFVAPPANTPFTNPGTAPFSPTGSGQIWCAAKSGLPDSSLQLALDYACGMGGADCSAIQEMGSCYTPNTLQAHASYAFNSYFQRNPVPTSCDFGGTAMIVTVNPSKREKVISFKLFTLFLQCKISHHHQTFAGTGSCIYPSSR
ncbi:Glucan endo-1,3-beta-glucosidase 1 [Apostasia shenzhenica]|uniref:Glucan endo-1,3-beta-glucosidase 1 n=1 Tax=Apostasia shenzhenica TaxID=1088818 RepID=A0A2I0A043_9ASPA|nr:Glucan endo-1,3-beta-glucosidase 1 [Apostasia shenzhenica]